MHSEAHEVSPEPELHAHVPDAKPANATASQKPARPATAATTDDISVVEILLLFCSALPFSVSWA
jgi:hypothetical protein